jgi:hypothetical protein
MPVSFLFALIAATGGPVTPAVAIEHGGLIERYCAAAGVAKPDSAVSAEIDRRLPDFRAAWLRDGPAMLAENVQLTGKPFRFRETLATLSACPDIPSMSEPLIINAVRYTAAYVTSPAPPPRPAGLGVASPPPGPRVERPLPEFAHDLWHEVTHRFVHDIIVSKGGTTPLLKKYVGESQVTRSHLHLFALDLLIARKQGRESEFDAQEAMFKARGMQTYTRAIEIVRMEGAQKFVDELR